MFNEQSFRLDGQVALVTGAGAGIGRSIAKLFANVGASVVVTDLNEDTAAAVASEITEAGGKAVSLACNVTKEEDLQGAVRVAVDTYGSLNILVNNAGGGGPKPFDMSMEDFRWAYEINTFSLFRLTQLAVPHLEAAGGGAILNISSMAGSLKAVNMASYGSSKAAVTHMTANIAYDLGPKNIRVNAIAPGAIMTDALATVVDDDMVKKMTSTTPLGRIGQPEDIAFAALFLCSPASVWVSGQLVTVSGGGVQALG